MEQYIFKTALNLLRLPLKGANYGQLDSATN